MRLEKTSHPLNITTFSRAKANYLAFPFGIEFNVAVALDEMRKGQMRKGQMRQSW